MTSRPLVSVYNKDLTVAEKKIPMPIVFNAPIRPDIVHFVQYNLAKNTRQAHGVFEKAGMQHSAESWGTGRAVARIPRVSGSGTHRSGQAAFGNQCRKGRMFAPLKTWRRWHRRVNIKQKRHAVASAIAASAQVPLVQARGHKIMSVAQFPLVFNDNIESIEKTKEAVNFLKKAGIYEDVQRVLETEKINAGKGKLRNNRWKRRVGPLFIYGNENVKLIKAVRNIPGVDTCHVDRLNLLQLAPGGRVGRFIVWTASAFSKLNKLFGTYRYGSIMKDDYRLQRPLLENPDIARIINSNEIQSKLKPAKKNRILHTVQKKNPLKNYNAMVKINPYAAIEKKNAKMATEKATKARQEIIQKKREALTKKQKPEQQLTKDQKKSINKQKLDSKKWFALFSKNMGEANEEAIKDEDEFRELTRFKEE